MDQPLDSCSNCRDPLASEDRYCASCGAQVMRAAPARLVVTEPDFVPLWVGSQAQVQQPVKRWRPRLLPRSLTPSN